MADVNGSNGNGEHRRRQLEAAAENATLRLVASWMMVVGVPAIIAAGAWFANRVISATDENTRATIELKQSFKSLVEVQIPGLSTMVNSRIDTHAQRLDGIDRRNEQQDTKIDELQRRVWRLPELSPAPSTSTTPSIQPYPR
jgi:hypothetical protein